MKDVKTNKEYQAMQRESDDAKKEISTCEDNALQTMEQIELLTKEIQELEEVVGREKARFDEEKAVLTAEGDKLRERLDRIEAVQAQVREKIEPNLVKHSEYLIKRRSGIAVAAVEAGVCQVCHLNIPPQKFIELQRDETIHQCPHCGRYIYWPGHEGYCQLDVNTEDL
jgi:predicted  nucleic acid-binding Zn-ribbon protein